MFVGCGGLLAAVPVLLLPVCEAPRPMPDDGHLLSVRDLRTQFFTRDGVVQAVRGVSFHVDRGEALGIVGESGCGKSVSALSIMGLVPHPGRVVGGEVWYGGRDQL